MKQTKIIPEPETQIEKEPKDSPNPTLFYSKLFVPLFKKDFKTVAEALDENCEWKVMPNMQLFKGKKECLELLTHGLNASNETFEIVFNACTPECGALECINHGVITNDLSILAMNDPDFILAENLTQIIGKEYHVAVCFVYHTNAEGKIYLVHEYFDLENLKKQLK
jgi:hypothetical protein